MSSYAKSQKISVTCRTCGITESYYSSISVKHFKLNHAGHDVVDGSGVPPAEVRSVRQQAVSEKNSEKEPGVKLSKVIVELANFPALSRPVFRVRGIKDDGEEAFIQVMVYEDSARVRGLLARGEHLDSGFSELLYVWEPEAVEYSEEARNKLGLSPEAVEALPEPETAPVSTPAEEAFDDSTVRAANEELFDRPTPAEGAKDHVFPDFFGAPDLGDHVLQPEPEWQGPQQAPARAEFEAQPELLLESVVAPTQEPEADFEAQSEATPEPVIAIAQEPEPVMAPEPMSEPIVAPASKLEPVKAPEPAAEPALESIVAHLEPVRQAEREEVAPPTSAAAPTLAAPTPKLRMVERTTEPRLQRMPEPRPEQRRAPPPLPRQVVRPTPRPLERPEVESEVRLLPKATPAPSKVKQRKTVEPKPTPRAEPEPVKEGYLLVSKSWYIEENDENMKEAVRVSKVLSAFRWKVEPIYTIGVMVDDIISIETTRNEFSGALIRKMEKSGYALSAVTTDTAKPIAWFKRAEEEDAGFEPGVSG